VRGKTTPTEKAMGSETATPRETAKGTVRA
jgi:hypothetical protein